jgi:LysR family glycine cleavage system transcriptional activator
LLSFTRAAAELNLTQAAVSKQVKMLEHYLGENLFERRARHLLLTKSGAAYLPRVRDSFLRLSEGTREVFGYRKGELLTLRVSIGFSAYWLGQRLHRFRTQHPGIDFRIISSVWSEEPDDDAVDLEIAYGNGNWPGFRCERLTREQLIPVACVHLLNNQPLQKPADLHGHTLLHVIGYEDGWSIWLQRNSIENINPGQGLQFDTSILAFQAASTGLGIALGRSSLLGDLLHSGQLVAPLQSVVEIEEAFYVLDREKDNQHPHVEIFRDWLLSEAQNRD